MKPIVLNAATGVRNDIPLERYGKGNLSVGVNIDIDETGAITRRLGFQTVIHGAAHSLWSDNTYAAFFVQNNKLLSLDVNLNPTQVRDNVMGERVSYASLDTTVYWSDGVEAGVVRNGASHQWGVTPPSSPTVSTTTGTLAAGTYGVTTTFLRADGHESGAPACTWHELAAPGGLSITIPATTNPDVIGVSVYMTAVNGTVPYLIQTTSQSTVTVSATPDFGVPIRTQFMSAAPAGQLVAIYNGRAYVAQDNYLIYSEPFEYELFDLRNNFITFPSRVTMVAPVKGGIYIGTTEKIMFLDGGGPDEFEMSPLMPYGVMEGTSALIPGELLGGDNPPDNAQLWMSFKGVCVGSQPSRSGPIMSNVTSDRYIMPHLPWFGASLLKIKSGTPHFIVSCDTMTMVMNVTTRAVWFYTNYTFNSFCKWSGVYLGAGSSGLVQLELDGHDDGVQIDAEYASGKMALSGEFQSRLQEVTVAAVIEGELQISFTTDDGEPSEQTIVPRLAAVPQQCRVIPPKGQRGMYWQVELKNIDGCDFSVDNVTLHVAPSQRRV